MKSIKYISMGIVVGGLFVGCCYPQATTESKVENVKCVNVCDNKTNNINNNCCVKQQQNQDQDINITVTFE